MRHKWKLGPHAGGVVAVAFGTLLISGAPAVADEVEKQDEAFAKLAGKDAASEHVAKHFSLLLGTALQDPFDFECIQDTSASPPKCDGHRQRLKDSSSVDVNAFIELGFRYRWAWLDRKPDSGEANENEGGRPDLRLQVPSYGRTVERYRRHGGAMLLGYLLPDDWDIRTGYVFGASDQSGAATIAGSDFYAHVGAGWQLVRMALPTSDPNDAPIRGTLDLEFAIDAGSDRKLTDVHGRGLLGPSMSFGVPLRFLPAEAGNGGSASIVELTVRGGRVWSEAPHFLRDDTVTNPDPREVRVEDGVAHYAQENGWGIDVEFAIPISQNAGYIFARSSLNIGFDPNPWGAQIGYTIPISSFLSALRSGK